MRVPAFAGLLVLGFFALRCDGGAVEDGGMGGADGTGGTDASGGTGTGGTAGTCEEQSCCLAEESYCDGDEIWERPLDPNCSREPALREECPYGCAVSTLYQFAYCQDPPQGGAGSLGGQGGG